MMTLIQWSPRSLLQAESVYLMQKLPDGLGRRVQQWKQQWTMFEMSSRCDQHR
jgi:hypothetical protein